MSGLCSKLVDIMKEGLESFGTAAIGVYKSLIDKIVTTVTTGVKVTRAVFSLLMRTLSILFDYAEGYVYLNDHIVALLGYFGEALEDDDLPSTVKRHLNELNRNMTEAEKYLEKIKKRIEELLQFVEDNLDSVITKTDLKRMQFKQKKIKRDLRVCKMYVADAETEVQNVEKSVNALLALYGFGVGAVAVGGGVAAYGAGAIAVGAAAKSAWATMGAGAVASGAIVVATGTICYELLEKSSSYAKWLTEFKNDKLPKLKQLNQEIKIREADIEDFNENVADLED